MKTLLNKHLLTNKKEKKNMFENKTRIKLIILFYVYLCTYVCINYTTSAVV